MQKAVTIIMYHYVREIKRSRFPSIKGLELEDFKSQLEYLQHYYQIISMEDLISAVKYDSILPKNAALLTFDDGYIDHFINVFPILDDLNIQGSFFPPAKAILNHNMLDVNKIHYILASASNTDVLIEKLISHINIYKTQYHLEDSAYYFKQYASPNRFDTKEVVFIKSILQKVLPEELRTIIINQLFNEFVTNDEAAFAMELYMTPDQLKCMSSHGMYIGSHGYDHFWLNTLDYEAQKNQIDYSINFLKSIDNFNKDWVMCYPYGAFDDKLLSILKQKDCIIGLTTVVDIADLNNHNLLTLPRLDTNDFPKFNISKPNNWTIKQLNLNT
ncbi:MAG: polysaccharide deacetylase family protein [Desulfobacterales bacterium]|nr:polysaccharide deacetylase family protein [Desulfobacterales bacterium]